MGHIFTFDDAVAYQKWFDKPKNKHLTELEGRLMIHMLRPIPGESAIDIGCGIGSAILPFLKTGISATGIDPSPHMIHMAENNLGNRADLYSGFAEDLPFEDNAFHHACLVKTLEFVESPRRAIEEACRVAKNRVFIGLMNRYSIKGTGLRVKRIFANTIYDHAHFFNIWDMKQMIREVLGDIPVSWRTICQFSTGSGTITQKIECSDLIQRYCPFGAFSGITITLVPRLRTRPLELRCPADAPDGAVSTGLARAKREA